MNSRREFLAGSLGAAGAAMWPRPAAAAPKSMTVVRESSFIKPFDDYFAKTLASEYEKQSGIKIVYEATSVGGMLTRLTTIAETKSGPEIAMTAVNWPHLFDRSLVDVSDVAGDIGKQLKGWHENVLDVVVVDKKWKALPWGNIGQLEVYRTDWFNEVGVTKFPDTWEDLLAAGRLLKKKGHPFGFELGHGFGDNHGWLYPRPATLLARADRPARVGECRQVRARRHVRQGMPGRFHQGRHRHRRRSAQADLQSEVGSMAVGPASVARPAPLAGRATTRRRVLEREGVFSWVMLAPGVLFLLAFVAYPFFYGIFLSLQDRRVASPGTFVGLANFVTQLQDAVFWQVTRNTFIYTIAATILKMVGGLAMALVMNQYFRGRNLARAFLLLPFIVPTVLSSVAWMWILDPTFSVINWTLRNTGLVTQNFSWLGNATLAMVSIIMVNTWRGLPFYGITLLAGLQTIPPDLYEAAAIDGASLWQRFCHITIPVIKPVLIIVTMFSIIFTFSDFQLIYVLTHGGPANATHLFATYAFDIGMSAGVLGMGAAVALAMLPALALLIVALTLYLRRV